MSDFPERRVCSTVSAMAAALPSVWLPALLGEPSARSLQGAFFVGDDEWLLCLQQQKHSFGHALPARSIAALSTLQTTPIHPLMFRRFMRFPGGCYIEGDWMRNAFRWKDSIGSWAERPGHLNGGCW